MANPVTWFEIIGRDSAALQGFYKNVFDWKVGDAMPDMGNYALVDGQTSGVAGGIGEEMDGQTRVTVYVQVPDLQATLDRAVANGGKVVMPPMEIPGVVSIAQFADPDGNVIGLTKG
jgi:predicted enzyme related to lactoylglutathione lyase